MIYFYEFQFMNVVEFYQSQFNLKLSEMKMVSWMWKWGSKSSDDVTEEELKKGGFDPTQIQAEDPKQLPLVDFNADYQGFIAPTPQQALALIQKLKFYPNDQEHRHVLAHEKGGKICKDKKQVSKVRSIGKQMIKIIGKKIISGDLNLTRISFPIKAMVPKTALENSTLSCCTLPYFMSKASSANDPVERLKYTLTALISANYYMNLFLKPLNPILGETLQGSYPDGTKVYCQQISHHPPISYFLIVGPNDSYKYYGSYAFQATAGLNSMTLLNKGDRAFEFQNGQKICGTFAKQVYSGVFMGTLRSEGVGGMQFVDERNNLKAQIKFGKVKKRPSDFFVGEILKNGKPVSKFQGSYCGFLNFDGIRYWDGRMLEPFKIQLQENPLESDFRNREDLQKLKTGNFQEAQIAKEKLQEFQRRDVKLRTKQINK